MDRPEDRRALIEVLGPDGRVQRVVDVPQWPLTLGRALHNTVVLDDPHVAEAHALVERCEDGRLRLTVGKTRNGLLLGTHLGRTLLKGGEQALLDEEHAAELQLGATRLRLRLPQEVLAPERGLSPHLLRRAPPRLARLLGLAVLLMLWLLGDQWLSLDPGAEFTDWLPVAVGMPLALLVWMLAWAAASKLFSHRFEFIAHAAITLRYGLALSMLDSLLPQAAGAFAWPWLADLSGWVQVIVIGLWLRAHLREMLPHVERAFTLSTAVAIFAVVASMLTLNQRRHDRWHAPAYLAVLPLPALRFGATELPEQFVAQADALRAALEARVRRAQREDAAEQAEDGDDDADDDAEDGGDGDGEGGVGE